MSFKINWNSIEKKNLSTYTIELLEDVLNSGKRPSILSSEIKIVDLSFGEIAPDFEILEIGDLANDKFRGIFKFKYYGDASITVNTKVSASPLKNYADSIGDSIIDENNVNFKNVSYELNEMTSFIKPNFNLSDCDFDIPLNLTLSKFRLSSIIVVVFSKTKGLTLVFKNDPLESIEVSSTFDRIKPIAKFLQKKIETQISELFKEFLPSILYKFSLKYTSQSFDQFHKDLLLNEELDLDEKKRVFLKDVDPESPLKISPGNLMRLTRLSTSRQTLTLGGRLSCDTMNKEVVTKSFVNAIIASNLSNFSLNKIQLSNYDFEYGSISNKVSVIKEFQTRNYVKNNHEDFKPKRRVIKMKSKKSKRIDSSTTSSCITTPSSPIASASTPKSDDTLIVDDLQSIPIGKGDSASSTLSTSTLINGEHISPNEKLGKIELVVKPSSGRGNLTSEKMKAPIYVPIQLNNGLKTSNNSSSSSLSSDNVYHIDRDEELKIHSRRMRLERLVKSPQHQGFFNPFLNPEQTQAQAPPPYSF